MTDHSCHHHDHHHHGHAPVGPVAPGTIYTCPMHPQIRQEGPGACPICGMALEPRTVDVADAPNPELLDMMRRGVRRCIPSKIPAAAK